MKISDILSKEEKIRILKAIEEDIESRYTVAGALGMLETLRRLDAIKSIEERVEDLKSIVRDWKSLHRLYGSIVKGSRNSPALLLSLLRGPLLLEGYWWFN